ncbi:MAG: hypothetical protein JO112_06305, partial [Planctomycetes bacterium]|nr:hypothetical protein [Planctomycetota bacterium]
MKDLGPRLVGISDVSLGYGSPQLPALMGSLLNHYAPAQAWILEPDQSERPARHDLFPEIHFRRLNTRFSPFTMGGMIEYNLRAVRLLEELAPDLVVVTSSATLPALLLLKNKPRVVIYYMLESLAYYAKNASPIGRLMMTLNRQAGPLLDLIIVPEENRAVLDVPRARFHGVPLVVAYNVVHSADSARHVVPAEARSPT